MRRSTRGEHTLNVNAGVVIAAVTMSIVATLGSSLVPIWLLDRLNPAEQLRRSYGGRRNDTRLAQRVLVAAQIALVMVLLLGASLLVISLRSLLKVELGFQPEALMAIRTRFLAENYGPGGLAVQDRVLGVLRSRPEVLATGWTSELPLGPSNVVRLKLRESGDVAVRYRIVSDGYLQAIGASVDRGRLFVPNDRVGAPVVIVNRSFADRHFNGREAVGQEVFIGEAWNMGIPASPLWWSRSSA